MSHPLVGQHQHGKHKPHSAQDLTLPTSGQITAPEPSIPQMCWPVGQHQLQDHKSPARCVRTWNPVPLTNRLKLAVETVNPAARYVRNRHPTRRLTVDPRPWTHNHSLCNLAPPTTESALTLGFPELWPHPPVSWHQLWDTLNLSVSNPGTESHSIPFGHTRPCS